jgi:hypothetical protein
MACQTGVVCNGECDPIQADVNNKYTGALCTRDTPMDYMGVIPSYPGLNTWLCDVHVPP